MHGRTYWSQRATLIIASSDGTVTHVILEASPKTYYDEVLAALEELAPA